MSFVPINELHAIVNVIFAVHVTPNFTYEELDAIKNAHSSWKDLLPAADGIQVFGVGLGHAHKQLPPLPPYPVSFTRYKSNGNPELRLIVDHDSIVIEFGLYSSWNLVWKNSRDLLSKVTKYSIAEERKITSCGLQYTDEFIWSEDRNYDISQLLNLNSEYIPHKISNYGPAWHLHQGWFTPRKSPVPGRTLERMHVSALEKEKSKIVQFENLNRFDMLDSNILLRSMFSDKICNVDRVFECLHDINKILLGEFLNDKVSKQIQLKSD